MSIPAAADLDVPAAALLLASASADFSRAATNVTAHHHGFDRAAEDMSEEWAAFLALDTPARQAVTGRLVGMLGSLMVASEAALMPREAILAALAAGER